MRLDHRIEFVEQTELPGGMRMLKPGTSEILAAGASADGFADGRLFAVTFKVLPSFGRGETVALGTWTTGLLTADGWKHLILPAVTLCIFQLTLIMRLVRAEMLEVLRTDYIKFARARGLTPEPS